MVPPERQAGGGGGKSGGIGTRGPGEQQIEIDRRIVQKRIALLKHEPSRWSTVGSARSLRVPVACGLVGYTNAGKSTLLNTLTGAGAFAADLLFATLDTVSRRWAVRPGVDIPVSDTVGFVRDLPHHLVASFRSTLAEALHADLLLHVVDASHPEAESQVQAVKGETAELGVDNDEVLGVLNKVDRISDKGTLAVLRAEFEDSVQVSALTGDGLDQPADKVVARRSGDWTELWLHVPHDQARLAARSMNMGGPADRWTEELARKGQRSEIRRLLLRVRRRRERPGADERRGVGRVRRHPGPGDGAPAPRVE